MASSSTLDVPTLDILGRLIAFDSTSRNSNLDVIDWARGLLEGSGAVTRTSMNAERTKANLFATWGGEGDGGLVLSGHTDVVPVDGQDWRGSPFQAAIRDGRVYGRGACDMKGFVAVAMARAMAAADMPRCRPLHVALTYDEEMGCLGIPVLIADLKASGMKPASCLVGEPTLMEVVSAHKGGRLYRCRVTGLAAHSSLAPQAVNAIEYGARVIGFVQDIAMRFRDAGPYDRAFDVTHSTISTNLASGGSGSNIVPAGFEFMFEHRFLPGSHPEAPIEEITRRVGRELLPLMRAVDPAAEISFECIGRIPALAVPAQAEVLARARTLTGDGSVRKVAYGTEASFFQEAGIDSIVCGPGSIAQAHKADEYVALEQLARCEAFVDGLIAASA